MALTACPCSLAASSLPSPALYPQLCPLSPGHLWGLTPLWPQSGPAWLRLLLGACGVGPSAARCCQEPSHVGFHTSCRGCSAAIATFPLNYLGLAPLPAPCLSRGSVTAAKSNPRAPPRDVGAPGPPSPRLRRVPSRRWPGVGSQPSGKAVYWHLSKWLNPFPISGKQQPGAEGVPMRCWAWPRPQPQPLHGERPALCWPGAAAPRGRHPAARHSGKAALAAAHLTVTGINY